MEKRVIFISNLLLIPIWCVRSAKFPGTTLIRFLIFSLSFVPIVVLCFPHFL